MKRHPMSIRIVLGLVLSLPAVRGAAAQQATSFEQLQVLTEENDKVTVTAVDGQEFEGQIGRLSTSSLRLRLAEGSRDFSQTDVDRITRDGGDPIGDGAKKGAYIGLAFGGVMGALFCFTDCRYLPMFAGFYTAFGAGVGLAADAMIREGERTIYRAPAVSSGRINVSPVVGNDQKGVRVAFGF
jgi:hypothetical protein